ncbi:hypothetical protein C8R45DRAFT_1025234 [Mycena sanguinolenta]|nr:hypothetical protein C8R45DRAFT_1025234 [Mycena sanguinolenta]
MHPTLGGTGPTSSPSLISTEPHIMALRNPNKDAENVRKRKLEGEDGFFGRDAVLAWDIPKAFQEIPISQAGMAFVFKDFAERCTQFAERATATASESNRHTSAVSELMAKSLDEVGNLRENNAKLHAELNRKAERLNTAESMKDDAMRANVQLATDLAAQTIENDRVSKLLSEVKHELSVRDNEARAAESEIWDLKLKLEQQGAILESQSVQIQEATATAESSKRKLLEFRTEIENYFAHVQTGATAFLSNIATRLKD